MPAVIGRVSAPDVQTANPQARLAQTADQVQRLAYRLDVRIGREDRRAQVEVKPVQGHVLVGAVGLEERLGPVQVHAELGFLLARGDVVVGLGVNVGVDPQRGAGFCPSGRGQPREVLELGLRLDVEAGHSGGQGGVDLLVGLAHAGEDYAAHLGARLPGAVQLAARDHVEARALRRQQAEDVNVRQRLDGEADRRIQLGEGLGQAAVVVPERPGRVDVHRRAGLGRDPLDGHVLAEQLAVPVFKAVH